MSAAEMKWRSVGASVRGASHVRDGSPNQDRVGLWKSSGGDPVAVLAVADGHGGARHFRSDAGAQIAVDVLIDAFRTLRGRFDESSAAERSRLASVELPTQLVGEWTARVREALAANPFSDGELRRVESAEGAAAAESVRRDPLLAYGATLLGALVTPEYIVLTQLGDGDVLTVAPDGATRRPLPIDERLAGNATTSICRPGAETDFRSVVLGGDAEVSLVLLSSDGYANSFKTDADFLRVGSDVLGMIRKGGIDAVDAGLKEILEHASAKGSGDDITLALAHRENETPRSLTTAARPGRARTEVSMLRSRLASAEGRVSSLRMLIAAFVVIGCAGWFWVSRQQQGAAPETMPAPKPELPRLVPDPKPDVPKIAPTPAAPAPPSGGGVVIDEGKTSRPALAIAADDAKRTDKGIEVVGTMSYDGTIAECTADASAATPKHPKLAAAPQQKFSIDGKAKLLRIPVLTIPFPSDHELAAAMKGGDVKVNLAVSCKDLGSLQKTLDVKTEKGANT